METKKDHALYIVLSKTETGFAKTLRKFGSLHYNHAAIAFDPELKELYAFARPERYGYLTARLIRETTDRYLINAKDGIPILVYKIPVTAEQLDWVRATVDEIMNDPKYLYNLFSVLTYPVFRGFKTYKAFSCVEFVAYILHSLGYDLGMPVHRCRPDDLRPILADYICYDGNLLDYVPEPTTGSNYFRPVTMALVGGTAVAAAILLRRSIPGVRRLRKKNANKEGTL